MPVAPVLRFLRPNTIFFKASAVLAVAGLAVIAAMTWLNLQTATEVAMKDLRFRATIITDIIAGQATDAMQSRKTEGTGELMEKVADIGGGDLVAAQVVLRDGSVLSEHVPAGADAAGMVALAQSQMQHVEQSRPAPGQIPGHADELGISADGMTVAHPAYFGKDNALVGMFVSRWTPAPVLAAIRADSLRILLISGAIFLGALVTSTIVMRSLISTPLTRVNAAMQQVAAGDYDSAIPLTLRGDEIGTIARSLDGFRIALREARDATLTALLKGSAFEGSSAALMITDAQFRITYTNRALAALFRGHMGDFRRGADQRAGLRDFSHDRIVTKALGDMIGDVGMLDTITAGRTKLPSHTTIRFGATSFQIEIDSVKNADGLLLGYVVEWKNVSLSQRNSAIITAIDGSLLRAEFAPDGRVIAENQMFTDVAQSGTHRTAGQPVADRLSFDGDQPGTARNVIAEIAAKGGFSGRLRLASGTGAPILLEATAGPIRDDDGAVSAILLLANDVTAAQLRLDEAEAARHRLVQSQEHVVDVLRAGLGELSGGNLTVSIDQSFGPEYDKLREDFNVATQRLREAMSDVIANAATIGAETEDISSAAADLSRRTEQQAATLEETAAALDQLNSSVKSAADTAARANDLVRNVKDHSEKSGRIVQDAVTAMREIAESSSKISTITGVIDDIAFQTNLLALNAGVEAARAGDAGRGFAVVASEVRALAQRSSDAARQIADLISASSSQVKRGVDLVGQAGTSLTGIESAITEVAGFVSDIAVSAKEQSTGLSEINTAVNQLDQVTQQNAAMFEETTAASQSLRTEARNLRDTIGRFRTGPSDQARAERPAPRAEAPKVGAPKAAAPRLAGKAPATASAQPDRAGRREVPSAPHFSTKRPNPVAGGAVAAKPKPLADEWQEF